MSYRRKSERRSGGSGGIRTINGLGLKPKYDTNVINSLFSVKIEKNINEIKNKPILDKHWETF
jgi:hypothetical protein